MSPVSTASWLQGHWLALVPWRQLLTLAVSASLLIAAGPADSEQVRVLFARFSGLTLAAQRPAGFGDPHLPPSAA
jgi:hypothetical protein